MNDTLVAHATFPNAHEAAQCAVEMMHDRADVVIQATHSQRT
jgi:hypothetical protein